MADGQDSLVATAANAATVLGGTENDTFSFSGAVRLQPGGWIWCGQHHRDWSAAWFDVWGGDPSDGASPIDGADYVSVASSSASALYGNSGADSLFIGGNATATSLYGGMDNDLVSITGDLSAGEIIGGSGSDTVIITGSLMGSATVTLDSAKSTEEANDSLTVGFISNAAVYGNQGDDSMVVGS